MNVADTLPSRLDAGGLLDWLEDASPANLDCLPFGLITMAPDGTVEHFNVAEARLSGLTPERVVGRHFFTAVAPCANNALVAGRFESEQEIDVTIDYVYTFRLVPTKVRLRLMKRQGARRRFLGSETCV